MSERATRLCTLERARWRVVHGPDAAANELVRELARLTANGALAPRDVAVGLLDAEARPFVERRLAAVGVATRWAAGRPLAATALARLVADVERFVAERRFEDFRALLTHPDVAATLERDLGAEFTGLAAALDEYSADACPARVGERFANEGRRADELARAHEALRALLGPLASDARLPLARWVAELGAFVTRIFDEIDLGARDPAGWERAQSFPALARLCDEFASARFEASACSAREALEWVAERVAGIDLPPPPPGDGPTLELFGWLELALDPAPHAVVVGFDEGVVPAPPAENAWLSERLRAELSLGHAARRVARDAWIATLLATTRSTLFVSTRRSLAGDPRVPSRLAFRGERERVLERVAQAFVDAAEPEPPPPPSAVEPFRPRVIGGPRLERMRVTGFRAYLESPYRFYLEHVLELTTIGERVLELDPLRFGSLAHDALQAFGESELARSRDADAIAGLLEAHVRAKAARALDPLRHAAVAVQLEQLVDRLRRFARWQARDRKSTRLNSSHRYISRMPSSA
jgi:ATP-dependent helicase/nuclease subunit B